MMKGQRWTGSCRGQVAKMEMGVLYLEPWSLLIPLSEAFKDLVNNQPCFFFFVPDVDAAALLALFVTSETQKQ